MKRVGEEVRRALQAVGEVERVGEPRGIKLGEGFKNYSSS